jgi:hypothetical protein
MSDGESYKWWIILDEYNRIYSTWENFEELFLNKWIKETKMEELYKIQEELNESK